MISFDPTFVAPKVFIPMSHYSYELYLHTMLSTCWTILPRVTENHRKLAITETKIHRNGKDENGKHQI